MDSTQKPNPRQKPEENDIDLGELFYRTGGVISNFFKGLGNLLAKVGDFILRVLFFLRRNLLWLLVGTILGMGYGLFLLKRNGSMYHSNMVVRANYNSSRALYGTMDIFNALISAKRTDNLADLLKISPAEAESLVYFEARPVKSEMITAEMYRDQFMQLDRRAKIRTDTFWINTIKYQDYKTALTKFDYPIHEIEVVSTNERIFAIIQDGIINQISSNELLKSTSAAAIEANKQELDIIVSSIESIDTLRSTYNKRLSASSSRESTGNSVTLVDGYVGAKAPELELYDKLLELKDELKAAKLQAALENGIIQVYSPFGSIGSRVSIFKQNMVRYAIIGFFITLFLLIGINQYKFLKELEIKFHRKSPATDQ